MVKNILAAVLVLGLVVASASEALAFNVFVTHTAGPYNGAAPENTPAVTVPGAFPAPLAGPGGAGVVQYDLWVNNSTASAMTLISAEITSFGTALISAFLVSDTLSASVVASLDNSSTIGGTQRLVFSNINPGGGCSNFPGTASPGGDCAAFVFNGAPDNIAGGPMLLGVLDVTYSGAGTGTLVAVTDQVAPGVASVYDVGGGTLNLPLDDLVVAGSVPEPATLVLVGLGLAGLAFARKRA
jgi:hypothetical protein